MQKIVEAAAYTVTYTVRNNLIFIIKAWEKVFRGPVLSEAGFLAQMFDVGPQRFFYFKK